MNKTTTFIICLTISLSTIHITKNVIDSDDLKPSPTIPVTTLEQQLYEAAKEGHLPIVRSALEQGAHVDGDLRFYIPLHIAVSFLRKDIVDELLAHKARVNSESLHWRDTPLQIVASTTLGTARNNDRYAIAQTLLNHGANIDTADKEPDTSFGPLWWAVDRADKPMVKLFLAHNPTLATVQHARNHCHSKHWTFASSKYKDHREYAQKLASIMEVLNKRITKITKRAALEKKQQKYKKKKQQIEDAYHCILQ